ncbi:YIP1 family protein [Shouchella sp. JSM 1781072]|uniref:YIP1 family protein n=1 Tax=Shouchella sp. JSM 1781072 TaxID=3344581 RepID=UPI0035C028A9
MEQRSEAYDLEEIHTVKKPNIFSFLFSPIKQFDRIRYEPRALGPMFLILAIVLIGLLIPLLAGQGGLLPTGIGDSYSEDMYMDEYYYESDPLSSINVESFIMGAVLWISILGIFAIIPPALALLLFAFSKMHNRETTYGALYSMTVFASLVPSIGFLYIMIMNTIASTYGYIYTAPTVFVSEEHLLYPFLASLEVSTILFIILIVIGLMRTAAFDRLVALAVGVGMYAVVFIFQVIGGML